MRTPVTVVVAVLTYAVVGSGLDAGQRGAALGSGGQVTGTIVGRVVDASTGESVAGAEVTVAARSSALPAPTGAASPFGPTPSVRLLSGSDGRFVVRDAPVTGLTLGVGAPGYLNGSYGQTRPGGPSRPVLISVEDRIVDVTVRLWKHASVSGVITDDGDAPAVNVMVRALRRSFVAGEAQFVSRGTGRTDDRGAFRISGLMPGDYVIAVPQTQTTMPVATMNAAMSSILGGDVFSEGMMDMAAAGVMPTGGLGVQVGDQLVSGTSGALPVVSGDGQMAAYLTQYFPAATALDQATVIALASGDSREGVDIRMPLVATAAIAGTVVGPDGPMANVQVRVVPAGTVDQSDTLTDVARGVTASNGAFHLYGVPVGAHVLKVLRVPRPPLPPGLADNPQMAALLGGRGGPARPSDNLTLFADVPVSVDRDLAGVAVVLSAGATVSGRVEFVGSAAQVPMTAVTVTLTAHGGRIGRTTRARVGEDGRFSTAGLVPGPYLLDATGRVPGWFLKSAAVHGLNALERPFALTSEDIGDVVVTFIDRQTQLSGTVATESGAPAEASVLIFPAAYREWIAQGMVVRLRRDVRTQANGGFSVTGLAAHDYLMVALADDDAADPADPRLYDALARVATPVTLAEGAPRTVTLKLSRVAK